MKKLISMVLVVLLVFSMAACSGPGPAETKPSGGGSTDHTQGTSGEETRKAPYKIGVVEIATGNAVAITEKYYSEYIGPRYNCEFVFSEACATADDVISFIENCADLGVEAIICNYNYDTEQLTQKAAEYGMFFCENLNRNATSLSAYQGNYDNFCGTFAANQDAAAKLFSDWIHSTLDVTEEHGFFITTGWAFKGNEQHYKIAQAMLIALQDLYGLTYDAPIESLLESSSPVTATNDKGIEIYCYPDSFLADGWVQGISSALQTGKYDYVLAAMTIVGYANTAIDEVEKAYNKNITVASFASLGDALTSSFTTQDMFGNSSVDMASVKYNTLVSAMAFIQVYNALTGHMNNLKNASGEVQELTFSLSGATNLEDLEVMNTWDQGDGSNKWVGHYDFIDSCLGVNHPELTGEQIQENVANMVYENIKAALEP